LVYYLSSIFETAILLSFVQFHRPMNSTGNRITPIPGKTLRALWRTVSLDTIG
jgi:hypothetical protein